MDNKIYFPKRINEVSPFIKQIIDDDELLGASEAKLLLYSLLSIIIMEGNIDNYNPNCVLRMLNSAIQEFDGLNDNLSTLVTSFEDETGCIEYTNPFWIFTHSEYQMDAIMLLYNKFLLYDLSLTSPVYDDNTLVRFPPNSQEKYVVIKDGTTVIKDGAFKNCRNLVKIEIPASVRTIAHSAFDGCDNLEEFYVTDKNEVFKHNELHMLCERNPLSIRFVPKNIGFSNVIIGEEYKSILPFAFLDIKNLTEVEFRSKSISIEDCGFVNCKELSKVIFPKGFRKYNERSFVGCYNIVDAPKRLIQYSSKEIECDLDFDISESGAIVKALNNDPANSGLLDDIVTPSHNVIDNTEDNDVMDLNKTPSQIKRVFDEYIIGHEDAKKTLSVAVYSHFLRTKNPDAYIEKSNILLCGPTGCGKTEFARTIARCMDVPFITMDATMITEVGWKGYDPSDLLRDLYYKAGEDLEKTQHGVIYIDEIDKLAVFGENAQRETFSKGVQQGLLKIIEGGDIPVPLDKNGMSDIVINTNNILFIVGGAFAGIQEKTKVNPKSIGFTGVSETAIDNTDVLETYNFVKYGMTQEFMGRFPIVIQLKELTENDVFRILTEPKNSIIEQYTKLIKLAGPHICFENDLLHEIAKQAIKKGTGARGLRSVLETIIKDIMYNIPDMPNLKEIIVSKGVLLGQEKPTFKF